MRPFVLAQVRKSRFGSCRPVEQIREIGLVLFGRVWSSLPDKNLTRIAALGRPSMCTYANYARGMVWRTFSQDRLWPFALLTLALGGGAAIGALGASRGTAFAWGLFAQGATAIGTVLLAAYTATLAKSTTREVAVSVEDQRARERPVVVAVIEAVGEAVLEPVWGERVPVVNVRLMNVGLGPALELHLEVSYPGCDGKGKEVVSVLAVEDDFIRSISIQNIAPPQEGFAVESFVLAGTFEGRIPGVRENLRVLADEGLRDLQRAAERIAAVRANPYFTVNGPATVIDDSVEYQATVGNTARGPAYDVEVVLIDAGGNSWGEPVKHPVMEPNRAENSSLRLRADHPRLSYRISWRDGEGEHSRSQDDVLQPLPQAP